MQLCLLRLCRPGLYRSSGLQKAQAIRMTSDAVEAAPFSEQVHGNSAYDTTEVLPLPLSNRAPQQREKHSNHG